MVSDVMQDLHYESLVSVADRIRSRDVSSKEVVTATLNRIAAFDHILGSSREVLVKSAISAAESADAAIGKGEWRGQLHGIPIGIKENIDVAGAISGRGMKIFASRRGRQDATVVRRLREAGAIIISTLVMTEGASLVHHPDQRAPINPWRGDFWAGASSSGSAVATAAGFCYSAVGTDTGGSIRMPASACGLSGIKPSWGRSSLNGIFPMAYSFDHVGPIARSIEDAAVVFGAMNNLSRAPEFVLERVSNVSIGVARGLEASEAVLKAVDAAAAMFGRAGYSLRDVRLPDIGSLGPDTMAALLSETAEAHAPHFGPDSLMYGGHLRSMVEIGRGVAAVEVADAVSARELFTRRLSAVFDNVDFIILPTLPSLPPTLAEYRLASEELGDVLNLVSRFTYPANVARVPAVSLPAGFSDGLPIGLQIIGRPGSEFELIALGQDFQSMTDFHTQHPVSNTWRVR